MMMTNMSTITELFYVPEHNVYLVTFHYYNKIKSYT